MALTLQQFVQSLRDSSVLPAEEMTVLTQRLTAQKPAPSAQDVAKELVKQGKLTKFQVIALFEGRGKSLVYGTYVVLDKIGAGGMGEVFKARHTRMKRFVALKILPVAVNRSPDVIKRFQREVEAAARLLHPNIVAAFDAGEEHGVHYIAMEFVDGCDLSSIVSEKGKIPFKQAVDYVLQAARGLEYAHGEGLIHRDIKPANLLLDKKGTVKILDMGLARFEELFGSAQAAEKAADGLTTTGQIMGTVDYMSPEQAEDTHKADLRSDIYSLGCTLHRLITGNVPFQADTLMLKLLAHRERPIPSLRAAQPDVPAELDAVFAKMVAKLPQDRYSSMTEVITALQSCYSSPAVVAAAAPTALSAVPDSEDVLGFLSNEEAPGASSIGRRSASSSGINRRASASGIGKQKSRASTSSITRGRSTAASEPTTRSQAEEDTHKGPRQPVKKPGKPNYLVMGLGGAAVLLIGSIVALLFTGGEETPVAAAGEQPAENAPADPATNPPDAAASSDAPAAGAPAQPATPATPEKPASTTVPNSFDLPAPATSNAGPPAGGNPAAVPPATMTPAKPEDDKPDLITVDNPMPVPAKTFDFERPGGAPPPVVVGNPQTHIVGVERGELPDLQQAVNRAKPGDTILIRHRGPLEFNPVELSRKSPLTIIGDRKGDADFWPILKQRPNPGNIPLQPGLFNGDQLTLTLRKLHLVTNGPQDGKINTIFALGSGRIELDECTVTVGVRGRLSDPPGESIPLVQAQPTTPGPIEVVINRSLLRGQRLRSCVQASDLSAMNVSLTHTTWAGGQAPFVAGDRIADFALRLDRCTIYNVPSVLKWQLSPDRQPSERPAVDVRIDQSIIVSSFGSKEPVLAWAPRQQGDDVSQAVAAGLVRWIDNSNVYDGFQGYALDAKANRLLTLAKWQALWEQAPNTGAREMQPYLHVLPDGYELQEVAGRDLSPRWDRAKSAAEKPKEEIGADYLQQPPALLDIVRRPPSAVSDFSGQPRGVPRVLRVHQKLGPYKTLEAVFADLQDDDIIEIGDDGPYTPQRNFTVVPGSAVLSASVDALTIRAADGANPVILLRDDLQEGHPPNEPLYLFSTGYSALSIDGVHVRFATASTTIRAATKCEGRNHFFRFTNGSVIDSPSGKGVLNDFGSNIKFHALAHQFFKGGGADIKWFENNVYSHSRQESNRYCFLSLNEYGHGGYLAMRNCVSKGDCLVLNNAHGVAFNLDRNTFLGQVAACDVDVDGMIFRCANNFVASPIAPFAIDIAAMTSAVKAGGDNALWLGARALTETERKSGANLLMSGPVLKTMPTAVATGASKDPYGRFRLKAGQAAAKMASDGGPAGARIELMPTLPALPPDYGR